MAKQTIIYGAAAGDGTGESLFAAFKKTKENFDELYGQKLKAADLSGDFVVSGLATPVPSNSLTGTMAAGVAYVNAERVDKTAGDTFVYTASSDTYVDLSDAGVLTRTAVANGAAAPALAAGSMRIEKVVTDATKIASVIRAASLGAGITLRYDAKAVFPATGDADVVYIANDTSMAWRWTGVTYQALGFNAAGTAMVDPTGVNPYGFALMPLDANGNAIANVALRKDTLANLLLVADAGDGEIAIASDADVMVRYLGSPSVATIFGRSTQTGFLYANGAVTLAASGSDVKLALSGTSGGSAGSNAAVIALLDATNSWVTCPAASICSHLELSVDVPIPQAGGTVRSVALQNDTSAGGDGSTWGDIYRETIPASATLQLPVSFTKNIEASGLNGKKLRLVVNQDSGSMAGIASHKATFKFHKL